MARRSKKRSKRGRSPEAKLTDDLLVEILRRLPASAGAASSPTRTLAGFFYTSHNPDRSPVVARHFSNIAAGGRPFLDPSLWFLPSRNRYCLRVMDCCNGLLLGRSCVNPTAPATFEYVVCSPATEKWAVVPGSPWSTNMPIARLGFEPATSPHFHVFEFEEDEDGYVRGVQIYSSVTRAWSRRDSGWGFEFGICNDSGSAFLNSMLHVITTEGVVAAVDVDGETRRTIPIPYDENCYPFMDLNAAFIDVAQGQLYLATKIFSNLSIWVLEDYNSEEWILKHSNMNSHIFRRDSFIYVSPCSLVSICPDGETIFVIVGEDNTLMACKMDKRGLPVMRILGHDCHRPFLPYVPNFSESFAGFE
ncbi:hypothetical protein ACP4OV_012716 [Aristida adscensionis]